MKWPNKIATTVRERSEGICEGCGKAPAVNMHHRKYVSRGGKSTVDNALHLCGVGNAAGCHGVAHSGEGHELGWSVNSWGDPRLVPVVYRGRVVFLGVDGRLIEQGETDF